MTPEQQELQDSIMKVADDWAKKFLEARINRLRKNKMDSSGDLIRSLEYALEGGRAESEATRLLVAFNDYGRIAEMRNISHDKWGRNAMTRLEDWIVRKGVGNFVYGFMQRRGLKTAPKGILNQIAWGIMVSRSHNKFRRNPWYNKAKSAAVTDLYNQVAASMLDRSADVISNNFNFKRYAARKGR
jgi:hypothetical protein